VTEKIPAACSPGTPAPLPFGLKEEHRPTLERGGSSDSFHGDLTYEQIMAAVAAGTMPDDEAERLLEAHRLSAAPPAADSSPTGTSALFTTQSIRAFATDHRDDGFRVNNP
jgi:hypothetical protein